ncbi:hypothetical protein EO244_16520 [Ancylomarina salipaludis]|uniref:Uncharacterized protein n=1 Tax=Ancylomarina salipaludis TaxID=2501299 RepID=A0A4Q1JHJ7_9BACT|nr:hypothetical protein [Ancylomarina salipaludis]RXQ87282.1 hypothetical protein EO244_16520 [Ancylomarina salipaludis]
MKNTIYLFIVLLVSCSSNKSKESTNATSPIKQKSENKINSTIPESLRDYRNYYYLADISTKDFAELYLLDSVMTNDYKKLYDCLDSLSSYNVDTRDYYFKVLKKALNNLEVVFHQKMGSYLVKNIDDFKEELLDRLIVMNDEEIRFYAQGIEVYLSKTPDKVFKWLDDLKSLEENSTPEKCKNLNLLFNEIENSRNNTME